MLNVRSVPSIIVSSSSNIPFPDSSKYSLIAIILSASGPNPTLDPLVIRIVSNWRVVVSLCKLKESILTFVEPRGTLEALSLPSSKTKSAIKGDDKIKQQTNTTKICFKKPNFTLKVYSSLYLFLI